MKTFPKTKQDFDALYAQVQMWKENELKQICEKYSGAPKIAEMNMLLDKEVQLLNGIERQRQILQQQAKKVRNEQILKKLGDPVKWVGYNSNWALERHSATRFDIIHFPLFFCRLDYSNGYVEQSASALFD